MLNLAGKISLIKLELEKFTASHVPLRIHSHITLLHPHHCIDSLKSSPHPRRARVTAICLPAIGLGARRNTYTISINTGGSRTYLLHPACGLLTHPHHHYICISILSYNPFGDKGSSQKRASMISFFSTPTNILSLSHAHSACARLNQPRGCTS